MPNMTAESVNQDTDLDSLQTQPPRTAASGGRVKAPMSQNTGMKIPKKNIHPWPFQSVAHPSVNTKNR